METKRIDVFEKTINALNQLSEEDAKSFLKLSYGFVNTAITGSGGDPVKIETVHKLLEMYERIPELNDLKKK